MMQSHHPLSQKLYTVGPPAHQDNVVVSEVHTFLQVLAIHRKCYATLDSSLSCLADRCTLRQHEKRTTGAL